MFNHKFILPSAKKCKLALTFICFILVKTPFAQENVDRLDRLKEEISVLENRMGETEAGRQNVIQQLESIDRKIQLRKKLVKEYELQVNSAGRQLNSIKRRISQIEKDIEALGISLDREETKLNDMREEVGKRLAYIYRRANGDRLTLLLGAADLNDLSQRQHYIQAVERFDRSRLEALREQRDKVFNERRSHEEAKQQLSAEQVRQSSEIQKLNRLIVEKKREEVNFATEKDDKNVLLDKIAGDANLLRALLEERKQALQDIEKEIARLEGKRPTERQVWQPDVAFKQLKGSLPWPLERHTIIQRFGQNKHPDLGTTTINPGIDLKADPGDPVYPVAKGQVTRIAWLRGFGTTLILSHGDGYYSVYARLGNVMVNEGDVVMPSQIIADVGESGIEGNFHFEVWGKREKQDPLRWLQ